MLFGNKKKFAIEIEFEENKQYAHILLYVSNIYIGRKDDITYVESFFASLENELLIHLKKPPKAFLQKKPKEIAKELFHNEYFNNIEIPKIENPNYDMLEELYITFEDTFDPFFMLAYRINNEEMMFCWELDDKYYEDKYYPPGIHCTKLNYSYVKNVIKEAISYVSNFK